MHAFPKNPIAAVTQPDPYPYYASLRAAGAVGWFDDCKAWALVAGSSVSAAFQLPLAKVRPPHEPVPAFLLGTRAGAVFGALARMNDGAAHEGQRARVMQLMGRLGAEAVAGGAAQALARMGGEWRQRRDGEALDELIRRLPVGVVIATLGFAEEAHDAIGRATAGWVAGLSPLATSGQRQAAIDSMDELLALLAAGGVHGIEEAAAHVAVLSQPHEATAGLMGAGLLRLAQEPHLHAAAIAGTLDWPRFGEEVLRHDPPVQNTRRTLAADAVIDGAKLRAGDTLLLILASAARDPAVHASPDAFMLDRPARPDFALGIGPHACPGGAAAVAIASCLWRDVVQHTPLQALQALTQPVSWRASVNARMPVFASPPPQSQPCR
jgi:cytochrome P450